MDKICIAVLLSLDIEHATGLLTGVRELASLHQWEVLAFHDTQNLELCQLVNQRRIQGIIGDLLSDRWIEPLRAVGPVALVHIGGQSVLHSVSTVGMDDRMAGKMAADHFLNRGYRDLFFAGSTESASGWDRRSGFASRAESEGVCIGDFPPLCLTAPLGPWESFVRALPPTAAVYAQDDGMARRVVTCCRQAGRTIAEEISIIGTGGAARDSFYAGCGISSVLTDDTAIGLEAAREIARQLKTPSTRPVHRRLAPSGLVLRETTGGGALHALVSRALDLMERRLDEPLTVETLAHALNVSRRLLELRFRQTLGRGPHAELTRLRMACARQLLQQPDLTIGAIAARCGFLEHSHFHACFKRHHNGQTPGAWRRRNALRQNKMLPKRY